MKQILLTMLAVVMITAANAQDTNGEKRMNRRFDPKEMVQRRTQQMAEKYQLTAEQAEKVKALNEKYMELARRYRDQRPERPEGERGERGNRPPRGVSQWGPGFGNPDMSKFNEELKGILTAEQYKAYEEDIAKRRNRHPRNNQ